MVGHNETFPKEIVKKTWSPSLELFIIFSHPWPGSVYHRIIMITIMLPHKLSANSVRHTD